MHIKSGVLAFLIVLLSVVTISLKALSQKIEYVNGIRIVHNEKPKWGDNPKISLEFVQQIGVIEGKSENYLLFKPKDIAIDFDGNIYILDSGNYRIQKYDANGNYLKTFGRQGEGPGEFKKPIALALDETGNIYVGDEGGNRIVILNPAGKELKRISLGLQKPLFRMNKSAEFIVINALGRPPPIIIGGKKFLYSTAPVGRPRANYLLQLFDSNGNIIKEFVPVKHNKERSMDSYINRIYYTVDDKDNIYAAYENRNLIEKYDPENKIILKIDRLKDFNETSKISLKTVNTKSIGIQPVNFNLRIPLINKFSYAIDIDGKGRIWVMSFSKQPSPEDLFMKNIINNVTIFEIYDEDGTLLGTIPWKYYIDGLTFKIFDDNIYIIDPNNEMCVYQYKIVEK